MAADVSPASFSPVKLGMSYLPSLPPHTPKHAAAYPRAMESAPMTALAGVVVDGRIPPRFPSSPRCRIRNQVGGTNRWRLPESLGGDLLGTSQALRSLHVPYNKTLMRIISGEHPSTIVNLDAQKPYEFPSTEGHTRPLSSQEWIREARSKTPTQPPLPASAPARTTRKLPSPLPLNTYRPPTARTPTPIDIFHYHSKHVNNKSPLGPDVLLSCLGTNWELHKPYLQKSQVLGMLLQKAESGPTEARYYRDPMASTLDEYINKSGFYSTDYKEVTRRLCTTDTIEEDKIARKSLDDSAHIMEARTKNMLRLKLKIKDSLVTKHSFAIALGNLYHDEIIVDHVDVVGVLAAASALKFTELEKKCTEVMMSSISANSVCSYHHSAMKYGVGLVTNACERWLELNLVPHLSVQIQLRELPLELLQKIIKSSRLFTFNEYSIYKVLCYWVFLQNHPEIQLMPSMSTVITYFNSLPRTSAYIEREEGQQYACLFMTLRLHGVLETRPLEDMLKMNIIPQQWVLRTLNMHYQALQGGGDMPLLMKFDKDAIRAGFVIDQEPQYHADVLSVHGFHFELKACRVGTGADTYQFYMQRLRPNDPTLSFRACERQTFSLRQDREVRYSIRVQCIIKGQIYTFTTGSLTKRFGLGNKTSRSEILTLDGLQLPIYATFSLFFPPS
ncbi:BTB/POZ domain-containing protein 16-like [Saccoglossus kowalevskii]|uniref:BTB/POZ domain-containing protein 16 n=1 Tax=Saccoglossus kowalevskii TaxID=10224 RepID=A0ABM0GNM5_SACKO|nr:PREDICTED: BTB/POZ domain-containing protein 16-like [Saccoglossus kowalevskii]